MSLRQRLGKIVLFAVLEIGALLGVPMNPRKIEELLNAIKRPQVVKKEKQMKP